MKCSNLLKRRSRHPEMRRCHRKQSAFSVMEAVQALTLFSLLMLAGLGLFSSGTNAFQQIGNTAFGSTDAANALRQIELEVREARELTVSADGKTLYYFRHVQSDDPTAANFADTDATQYSFFVNTDKELQWSGGGATRTLLSDVTSLAFVETNNVVVVTITTKSKYGTGNGLHEIEQSASTRISPRNIPGSGS